MPTTPVSNDDEKMPQRVRVARPPHEYVDLTTSQRRVVDKLIRCMKARVIDPTTQQSINRLINRENAVNNPQAYTTGWLLFYSEHFKRPSNASLSVTQTAKSLGAEWKRLGQAEKATYNTRAATIRKDALERYKR